MTVLSYLQSLHENFSIDNIGSCIFKYILWLESKTSWKNKNVIIFVYMLA